MSTIQNVEEEILDKPIILVVGKETTLVKKLIEENLERFRVIYVTDKKTEFKKNNSNFYYLSLKEVELLPKLKEQIDYSIIFLGLEKQKDELLPVFEKAKLDNGKTLILVTPENFKTHYDLILANKKNHNFFYSILGDIIDSNDEKSKPSQIISDAMKDVKVEIAGFDNLSIYPIFLNDAIKNIYRLLFGSFKNNKLYFIFYKTPETLVNALHIVSRVNPDAKISFNSGASNIPKTVTREEIFSIASQNLMLSTSYMDASETSFETNLHTMPKDEIKREEKKDESFKIPFFKNSEKAEKVISSHKTIEIQESKMSDVFLKKAEEKVKRKSKKNRKNIFPFFITSLFFGFLVYLVINIFFGFLGYSFYNLSLKDFKNLNFKSSTENAKISSDYFKLLKPNLFLLTDLANVALKNNSIKNSFIAAEKNINLIKRVNETFDKTPMPGELDNKKLEQILSDFSYLYTEVEVLNLKEKNPELSKFVNSTNSKFLSTAEIIPAILGVGSEKKILLLFQNSNDLRPTGGLIEIAGLITANNGKFENFKLEDSISLDGNLKEHIEPPFIVKRFLQPHLYLRDSNFDPLFTNSAGISEKIYGIEKASKADFVLAINSSAIEKYLKILGSVKIDGVDAEIDSKNYATILKLNPSNDKNSSIDKSILEKLISTIFNYEKSSEKEKIEKVLTLIKLIEEKDILIFSTNANFQEILNANNLSGGINVKNSMDSLNDFLYINDFNLESNKVNSDILRNTKYSATIVNDKLHSSAEYLLDNKNKFSDYKVYIRFLVPSKSKLAKVYLNGQEMEIVPLETNPKVYEKKAISDEKMEFEESEAADIKTFGFLVQALPSSKTILKIEYQNGLVIPKDKTFSYNLKYIKQPGTNSYPFTYSFLDSKDYMVEVSNNNFASQTEVIEKDFDSSTKIIAR